MGDKLKNLVKTASADNAKAKEEYKELLKVGQVIGEGIAYELFGKEGALFKEAMVSMKAVGTAVGKGAKAVDKKVKTLGGQVIAKVKGSKASAGKFEKPLKKRLVGYGGAGAVGAGTAAVAHKKKAADEKAEDKKTEKIADQPVLLKDHILHYEETNEGDK